MDTGAARDAVPTRDELLDRARSLVPLLADRAAATEVNRTLLPEIDQALDQAGLYRIALAPYLGGHGLEFSIHLEVAAELARGCGSTAWVQCLTGYQNMLIGLYPKATQDEVLAAGAPIRAGLVMGPPVTAERADGGVVLTGRWPYVSGVDQATWLMLSARDPDAAPGAPRVLTCLLRNDGLKVDDDWFAMGLRGTGSKTVVLDRLFVPDSHVMCFRDHEGKGAPGAEVNRGVLYSGFPTSTLFAMVIAGPALGLAEAAIEAYGERLRTRWNARMPSLQTEWPSSQARLGRARARADAARRSYFHAVGALFDQVAAGDFPDPAGRVRYRLEIVEVVRACTDLVYDLFCDAGTGVMLGDTPLQRAFRDIHILRSHFMLTPDGTAENAGLVELRQPPRPPFI